MRNLKNIESKLDKNFWDTCEKLKAAGYIFYDIDGFILASNLNEASGKCISTEGDKSNDFTALNDDFDNKGFYFSLKLTDLLGWDIDLSTVDCYDFKSFVDELEALLEDEGVIMQTWKYKACSLLPAPILVWEGSVYYGSIYKLPKIDTEFLKGVAEKIKDLAISHLVWDDPEQDEVV